VSERLDIRIDATERDERQVWIVPHLVVSGLTASVVLLSIYSVLCVFFPAEVGVRANTLSPATDPKPAWYFLFLWSYLRSMPPLARVLTPVVLLFALAAWPFLDRNPAREPARRVAALALAGAVVIAVGVLTYTGWRA
jgi:quinol-cytochrome oxidoreductase complex cytochrome b subunit